METTTHLTFLQLAINILESEKKPLSPEEIWKLALEKGLDVNVGSKGKTPVSTLGARIYIDIRYNPNTKFIKSGSRPTRFFLKSIAPVIVLESKVNIIPSPGTYKTDYLEKELHPFLVYYAFYHLRAYMKTIHHTKSKRDAYSEWTHPDIVGCYFGFGDWQEEVIDFSTAVGKIPVDLLSFELKRELNFTNLRESFFQAVSNSSWANEGYLVAAEISEDDDLRKELERLSSWFGIGIIRLNLVDPDASEILYPAHHKDNIDWETVNKMAKINTDFKEFLKRIKNDISTKEVIRDKYDAVKSKDELYEWGSKNNK